MISHYFSYVWIWFKLNNFQAEFVEKHKAEAKKFGMLRRYEDSQQFLLDHPELVCEETANVLVIWCIDLAMEEVRFNE